MIDVFLQEDLDEESNSIVNRLKFEDTDFDNLLDLFASAYKLYSGIKKKNLVTTSISNIGFSFQMPCVSNGREQGLSDPQNLKNDNEQRGYEFFFKKTQFSTLKYALSWKRKKKHLQTQSHELL